MSRVVHRQNGKASRADCHRWAEVHDLMSLHRKGASKSDEDQGRDQEQDDLELRIASRYDMHVEPYMRGLLLNEAHRLNLQPADRDVLVEAAAPLVRWAEHYTRVADSRTIARFAAEAAYDQVFRVALNSVISQAWPRRWWTTGGLREIHYDGHEEGQRLAFESVSAPDILRLATNGFTADKVAPVNTVEPYVSKALPRTWGWVLDPLRPPIAAVRLAAGVIERGPMPKGGAKVLAVEPGLTAAAQASTWFLPSPEVHTVSGLLGEQEVSLAQYDAVVVNLPAGRAMSLVAYATRMDRAFDRWEMGQFHDMPTHDPGTHAEPLVKYALDHLKPGGVLVLMGDIDCGIHHQGSALVARDSSMQAIPLTSTGKPVAFRYTEEPWTPFGGLPATDRFVSAWRRSS